MDGILNVYKPAGMTSHGVVAALRRITGIRKIGHTGTLDPDAEGVLPVCIGRATKAADMLTASDKRYRADFQLGVQTDTQDLSGTVLQRRAASVSRQALLDVLQAFTGEIEQVPPMYSALKVGGQKLCDLARRGIEVERKPRMVQIYSIDLLACTADTFRIDVHCSKGTYIRTLGHDIGLRLGCGAAMSKLVRTASAGFSAADAVPLEGLTREAVAARLVPVDRLFPYEAVTVAGERRRRVLNGNSVAAQLTEGALYKVYDDAGCFLCISRQCGGMLKPEKMFFIGECK